MTEDKTVKEPSVYLLINKKNKVVAYSSINIPTPIIVKEDEDNELYKEMIKEGALCLANGETNFVVSLGLKEQG